MKYDIFLAGVWEEYAPFPYKSMIKERFPKLKIYDPEKHPSQERGDWFKINYGALLNSKLFFVLACPIPFSMAAVEAGMYYRMHANPISIRYVLDPKPLETLIVVWPEELNPKFGKEAIEKYGCVFEEMEEALDYIGERFR